MLAVTDFEMDTEELVENKHPLVKSRDIPISSYYELLQIEFISYKIREKIYKRAEDKKKFSDIANMKKKKIDSFAMKNCLPSIFNGDPVYLQKYLDKFFGDNYGLPNFQYHDSWKVGVYGRYDPIYYFSKGTEVKFKTEGEIIIGTIIKYYEGICEIKDCNGTKYEVEIANISRLLTDDFLNLSK